MIVIDENNNDKIIRRVTEIVYIVPDTLNKTDFPCKSGEKCKHCDYLNEIGLEYLLQ
jgi:hypothetical protein